MAYFREFESIELIVSPQIVTVVSGAEYVEGIATKAFLTTEDSVHLSASHLAKMAVESPVSVKVVFPVRVGEPGTTVQNDEPPPSVSILS